MSEEERNKIIRVATFYTNIAYLLVDIQNTFMRDAISYLSELSHDFKFADKKRWKEAEAAVRLAKKKTEEFAQPIYNMKDVDDACEDSDYLMQCIKLIVAKTNNTEKSKQAMLKRLQSLTTKNGIEPILKIIL